MSDQTHNQTVIRVRYSETDQMGTFYNSRALEWFEVGRTELLRQLDLPYREMESRGAMLPLVEAHVEYLGRAQYDDALTITTSVSMQGRARVRFEMDIQHENSGGPVARGWTVHAVTDPAGKAIRPPKWLRELLDRHSEIP
ncbi:MAG: acyl-CoA thioesterase [Phycisphaerae bacterium]